MKMQYPYCGEHALSTDSRYGRFIRPVPPERRHRGGMPPRLPRVVVASIIAVVLGAIWGAETMVAQDGSPVQPEFVSPPVPAGPSVNQFTGDFTFGLPILTVPGPNGSGHSLTLSYRAGTNPNGEVGWVGYGWSLNPGAIVRQKRGFPDDVDGEVTIHAKQPVDYVISKELMTNAEISSIDLADSSLLDRIGLSFGIGKTIRYDSRTGFGDVRSVSSGISLLATYIGNQYMSDNGEGSHAFVLSPNLIGIANLGNEQEPQEADSWFSVRSFEAGTRDKIRSFLTSPTRPAFVFGGPERSFAPPARVPMSGRSTNDGSKFGVTISPGASFGGERGGAVNLLTMQPQAQTTIRTLGYMHSAEGGSDSSALMDFYYENDVPFLKNDEFLPIPFSNADIFTVVGGGSFRLYNRGVGRFRTNEVTSEIDVDNENTSYVVGVGVFGLSGGVGFRKGIGTLGYESGGWRTLDSTEGHTWITDGDEPWFFRYLGDRGGTLLYDDDDDPVEPSLLEDAGLGDAVLDFLRINDADRLAQLPSDVRLQLPEWQRPRRNGYVGFATNAEFEETREGLFWKSYTKDEETRNWIGDRAAMADQIGEFSLYGTGKARHVYGLPVYARQERMMSISLPNITLDSSANVHANTLAFSWTEEFAAERLSGQENDDPYATMWLLTQKTTPDYVDLTGDGPTNDDLGGWTLFHYVRTRGDRDKTGDRVSNWHSWRAPYRGLAFSPGTLSDPEDDAGSWAEGIREQYYLEKIETSTHYALFKLNSVGKNDRRKDAFPPDPYASKAQIRGDSTTSGASFGSSNAPDQPEWNHLRYLDRIELYVKGHNGGPDSLISRTYFDYDYSLRPNMPNSLPVHHDSTTRHGMLTLRKVWTEPLTVRNATIRPWIFSYDYRRSSDYTATLRARYPAITRFADTLTAEQENPSYSPFDLDPWGSYRPSMLAQRENRRSWIDQSDTARFDPAAWQLKRVRMPTGGEIQVQYEEDNYAFVQDRPVMVMARLRDSVGEGALLKADDDQYRSAAYVDLSSLSVDSSNYEDVSRLRERIEALIDSDKKLYFSYLYALHGDSAQLEDPEWSSERVEGYADVEQVTIGTHMDGGSNTYYSIQIKFVGKDGLSVHEYGVPKRICWDLVRKRHRGKLGSNDGVEWSSDTDNMEDELELKYYDLDKNNHCKDVDWSNSYVRIPLPGNKRGGGLRVKRLLTFDPGIEGDSALYGTEYRYEVYNQERREVISSGVATNEPAAMRDENSVVAYMAKEERPEFEGKVISGRDRARNEGPIGETILPAASIGYSRVVAHPIHQGASTSGFAVTDFYTVRDFPFDARYPGIGPSIDFSGSGNRDFETNPLFKSFIFYRQNEVLLYRAQGYRFVQTDMHGKPRRTFTNGGLYSPYEDDWMTSASTEYDYFLPGDSIPLLRYAGDTIRYGWPGKTMEVVHAHRRSGSYLDDAKGEVDVGLAYYSGFPYFMVENSELNTHVTSKVIHYPAILRGVASYADGNYEYRENVAFDPQTGSASVVRTRDAFHGLALDQSPSGHEGSYRSYGFRAMDVHPEFGPVAANEGAVILSNDTSGLDKGIASGRAYIDFYGSTSRRSQPKLSSGDLVSLTAKGTTTDYGAYHVDEVVGDTVWLVASEHYNAASSSALTETGAVDLLVIRSGRLNASGMTLGGVATYGTTDADAAVGADFDWSGSEAGLRRAFVDQLNTALTGVDTVLSSANVSSSLSFVHPDNGTCDDLGTLGISFNVSTSTDTNGVVIKVSGVRTDTLTHHGLGGRFALDDGGQIVYRVHGYLSTIGRELPDPGPTLSVPIIRFCGDGTAYRTVANAIGGSAIVIDDAMPWDETAGTTGTPDEGNGFERGERGRWSARTGYAYRTDATTGTDLGSGERTYANAGVLDDFSLFNWRDPASSDFTRWYRGDSVTLLDRNGTPLESIDRLGRRSTTRLRPYRNYNSETRLVEQVAWNAADSSVDFEGFENSSVGGNDGRVVDDRAHSGRYSERLVVVDSVPQATYLRNDPGLAVVRLSEQLMQKGGVLRAWVYPDTNNLRGWNQDTGAIRIVPTVIARVGEWTLIECVFDTSMFPYYYAVGDKVGFGLFYDGPDTVWIDDVKFQPLDAVSTAIVYDPVLIRPIASFDDDNFGIYPIYDGEGKAVRSVVETARGKRTVADGHAHVPGVARDWVGAGSPWIEGTQQAGLPQGTSLGDGVSDPGATTTFGLEIGSLHLGLDEQRLDVFGVDVAEVVERLREAGEDATSSLDRVENLATEFEELRKERDALRDRLATAAASERAAIESEIRDVESRGDDLLKQIESAANEEEESR